MIPHHTFRRRRFNYPILHTFERPAIPPHKPKLAKECNFANV